MWKKSKTTSVNVIRPYINKGLDYRGGAAGI